MIESEIRLIDPYGEFETTFMEFCEHFGGPMKPDGIGMMRHAADHSFEEAVDMCLRSRYEADVKPGWVKQNTYWLMNNQNQMVGTVDLRHTLNDLLFAWGGHVGYSVHPDHRRKGYATFMLSHVIRVAEKLGINTLLITCEDSNEASRSLIEKFGGELENKVYVEERGVYVERRWLDITNQEILSTVRAAD